MSEITLEEKQCCRCKESKSLDEFTKNRSQKDGLCHYCRTCANGQLRDTYHKDVSTSRIKNNTRRFKLYHKDVELSRERGRRSNKQQYWKDIEKSRQYNRDKQVRHALELSDMYIKKDLAQGSELTHSDIPQELIELKREQIKLGRVSKEIRV